MSETENGSNRGKSLARAMAPGPSRSMRPEMLDRQKTGELRIGTSGWHYDSWRGPFYPPDLNPRISCRSTSSGFPPRSSTTHSIDCRPPRPSMPGAMQLRTISCLPGKPPAHHTSQRLKDVKREHCLRVRADDRFGKQVRPRAVPVPPSLKADPERRRGSPDVSTFCRRAAATLSNSGTRAGTRRRS